MQESSDEKTIYRYIKFSKKQINVKIEKRNAIYTYSDPGIPLLLMYPENII